MKPKVLIEVRGGVITTIVTSEEMDIIVIDRDEQNIGENPVSLHKSDAIYSNFAELYAYYINQADIEVAEELKRLKM
jgi:hypothetical protein